jgi:hypothetical protein
MSQARTMTAWRRRRVLATDEYVGLAGLLFLVALVAISTLLLYALERALPHAVGRPELADPLWPAWLIGGAVLVSLWALGLVITVYLFGYRLQERAELLEGSLPPDLAVHRHPALQSTSASAPGQSSPSC